MLFGKQYVLDAWNLHTDRLSRALCFVLKLAAAVKCTCIFQYFYMKLMINNKQSEQDKTSDISK